MKTILRDYSCYVHMGTVETETAGEKREVPRPMLILLPGAVAHRDFATASVDVEALLDLGNDVTILKPQKLREVETRLGARLPLKQKIKYYADDDFQPAFDLAFIFPGDHAYFSTLGIVTPRGWDFDVADLWLGQDILSQLQVTCDGVQQTVTIIDPETLGSGTGA